MSEPTCAWNETARKNQKSRNSGCGLHWIKKCFPWSVQVNLFTFSIILSVHSILGGFTSPSVSSVSPKRSCDDSHNTQNIHPMPHLKLSMGGTLKRKPTWWQKLRTPFIKHHFVTLFAFEVLFLTYSAGIMSSAHCHPLRQQGGELSDPWYKLM